MNDNPFRELPAVSQLLIEAENQGLIAAHGRPAVLVAIRQVIGNARTKIKASNSVDFNILAMIEAMLSEDLGLRSVINATGILLNTGLGRAPLAQVAVEAVAAISSGYCNLELDLQSGQRGARGAAVEAILRRITKSESALIVNNNAAATVLALRALANGREVIVSRGQLIEIGGSFRLPEIFEASGAKLVEVGTTNRTRLKDYERAIGPNTAAILHVHPSNYRVVGFTESVPTDQLAELAHSRGLWMIDDIGSGLIECSDLEIFIDEPNVIDSISNGADVVLFSGDKLLGGPQAGIIVGRASAIDRLKSDPFMRAFRVDKMTLAALEATLQLIDRFGSTATQLPLWKAISATINSLEKRGARLVERLREVGYIASLVASEAMLGGGTTPTRNLASRAIQLLPPFPHALSDLAVNEIARLMRIGPCPLISRVQQGAIWLDLRSIDESLDDALISALIGLLRQD
jgi:L-seryl-tRNA(Ser) seleniumtransferase